MQESQAFSAQGNDVVLQSKEILLREANHQGKANVAVNTGAKPVLVATYWFNPETYASSNVVVKFIGQRAHVEGANTEQDYFEKEETIRDVSPGCGPISITTRVHNLHPGEWYVTAHVQQREADTSQPQLHETSAVEPRHHFWRRWAPSVDDVEITHTSLAPFAHIPGIFSGFWGGMVLVGVVVALIMQSIVFTSIHLKIDHPWLILLLATIVGIIGSKCLYMYLYRRMVGWCIQGFVTGSSLSLIVLLLAFHVPVGTFLDATAPGLFIAIAIGRIGCFYGGCCGGPLTSSLWGVWSSDQRIGARRVPTQLMELLLASVLGIAVLVIVLVRGTQGGLLFLGSIAAYTLVRQEILNLRAEPCKSRVGRNITAILSALMLVFTLGILA